MNGPSPVPQRNRAIASRPRRAEAGELPRIAPRRFDPAGEAWRPGMQARRGPWAFTLLHSDTARAHRLGRVDDRVVIDFHRDDEEGRRTGVPERRGPLRGRSAVRGRGPECLPHHGLTAADPPPSGEPAEPEEDRRRAAADSSSPAPSSATIRWRRGRRCCSRPGASPI